MKCDLKITRVAIVEATCCLNLVFSITEFALKFKEVCGIQAEAYSGAEVQHGPMALVEAGFPMLVFAPHGPAHSGLLLLAMQMRQRQGARHRAALLVHRDQCAGTHRGTQIGRQLPELRFAAQFLRNR